MKSSTDKVFFIIGETDGESLVLPPYHGFVITYNPKSLQYFVILYYLYGDKK